MEFGPHRINRLRHGHTFNAGQIESKRTDANGAMHARRHRADLN
jgi:hypothetical protein